LLTQEFGITLSLEDFCSQDRDEHGDTYFVNALDFAEVGPAGSLLVITCAYVLASGKEPGESPTFDYSLGDGAVSSNRVRCKTRRLAVRALIRETPERSPVFVFVSRIRLCSGCFVHD
jgi:hypothetical protein